jgi:diguanylate cyclase (GGDEF)-like protein
MKEAAPRFEEPWPDDETQLVVDAVRSAVSGRSGGRADPLAEAGRRWARAHQSASLMRARLSALEASMNADVGTASEADRIAYYRAWRTVTDAATWTSLTQLEEAALIDPLTGVGNRRALDLMLTRAMSGARRAGSKLVVAAVDLDGLKRINDSRGHAQGDRTLTSLVNAFGEGLRASDTVFRTGGDEFAVVLPGMGLGDVDPLMHRISAGGTPAFTWGASALTAEHQHPAELLDAADTDLYRRRGVERESAGAGGGPAGGARAGAVVVGLHHSKGSIRTRLSRRANLAVAAALVAIAGTLGAVTPLSSANHVALPGKHPSRPSGSSGVPAVAPPTSVPRQSPASGVPPTTTPTVPTTIPATSGASSSGIQLADMTTPSPGPSGGGSATTNPTGNAPPSASPPTATAPTPIAVPPTMVPASTPPTNRRPTVTLPAQAAAAQAAHEPEAHVATETATDQGTADAPGRFSPSTGEDRGRQLGSVRKGH